VFLRADPNNKGGPTVRNVLVLGSLLLLASSLSATTVKGKANPNKEVLWVADLADPAGGAQVTVTLEWTKAGADLIVLVLCDIGIIEIFGAGAASNMDRIQRVEAGIVGTFCGFGVGSLKGASKFKMSVLDAGDRPLQKAARVGRARVGSGGLGRLIPVNRGEWPEFVEKMEQLKAFHRRAAGLQ
jgi:hypothetical protein